MENYFFDTWQSLSRSFVITILAYIILIFMLRTAGKRTLSKMNAFDFVVTIALGSALATVALNKNVALLDGILVIFLLIMLQYIISTLSVKYKKVKNIITSKPALLLYKGEFLDDVMKEERITKEEILYATRERGISGTEDIYAVVLEATGKITVIPKTESTLMSALEDVKHFNSTQKGQQNSG